MHELLRVLIFLVGAFIVVGTLLSAVQTFVVPRNINVWLTRMIFRTTYRFFALRLKFVNTYAGRDSIMARYAPFTLLIQPIVWLILIVAGYTCMFWSVQGGNVALAFKEAGSSLFTLGFSSSDDPIMLILMFSAAGIGLGIVALVISYLPTIYAAFSKREVLVGMLEVRAGSPPTPATLLARAGRNRGLGTLGELWQAWEVWFAELEETHTSLGALTFFRSPQGDRSWITAAGAVLDSAAITLSTVDLPFDFRAALCIRGGYIALRHICDFFRIPYNPNPSADDPISISRDEFDVMYEELVANGVPVKPDREGAWRDYRGWRVNYDTPLLELAALTMAPYAPWISDRSLRRQPRRFRLFSGARTWETRVT